MQGLWVPEFVLDYPEVLRCQHYEFARAGSDVTEAYQVRRAAHALMNSANYHMRYLLVMAHAQSLIMIVRFAFTQYHTHRRRMDLIDKADKTEEINRVTLKIAREVAEETGTLFAGGLSNTRIFDEVTDRDPTEELRALFEEQVRWSKEEGVDYVIAETMKSFQEAKVALEVIKSFDLPAVVTLSVELAKNEDGIYITPEEIPVPEACHKLLEMGATLVGVNCTRGPATMIEVVEQICQKVPPEKVCALPIAYRTTPEEPTWHVFTDKGCPENTQVYPDGLEPFYVTQFEIVKFTKRCLELGLRYIGICCGNTGSYTRTMAEAMGKNPSSSKYHTKGALAKAKTAEFLERMSKTANAGTAK